MPCFAMSIRYRNYLAAGRSWFACCWFGVILSARPIPAAEVAMSPQSTEADPYLWLEDVAGERALAWVREQSARTTAELEAAPGFEQLCRRLLDIFNSDARIPFVTKFGAWYYNFWRDEDHVRGIWRRTTLEEYREPEPTWATVLDLDQLGASEGENWVWKGASVLRPSYDRALVRLSRGGADAVVVREFDLSSLEFVAEGFSLPEAKSDAVWRDRDTLYVGTDFGPGSLTDSGYPRIIKQWRRGTPLAAAATVFTTEADHVGAGPRVVHDHGRVYEFIDDLPSFFTTETRVRRGDRWVIIDKPADAEVGTFQDQLLLRLKSDWPVAGSSYLAGSLLAIDFAAFLEGGREFEVLFVPTARTALAGWSATKNHLITNELDNVRSRLYILTHHDDAWSREPLPVPDFGSVDVDAVDPDESDGFFLTVADFLTPSGLYLGALRRDNRELLKSLPGFFDSGGLEVAQHEVMSRDGTRVPYFQVGRAGLSLDGSNPTLLYGYGGFEVSMLPGYRAATGAAWLERGGVFVLANIRGGGEFGPDWHNAVRRENRQRAFDDFIAIAEDLIARRVTSAEHLGIQGGSNGGLLMGVMFTQRPELFGAVVCQVPLLDMRRYNQLLAGASWMDEYGNPDDPEDWAFIRRYSPYHNVFADRDYPRVFFTTSTRDDRVHPAHARKMVARMQEQGHNVLYYENIEGGHGGSANNTQAAYMQALAYTYLWEELR